MVFFSILWYSLVYHFNNYLCKIPSVNMGYYINSY
ncbi:hypothetical protein [Staphylococcus phage vB_SauM-V1SA22]|nr:hypothetical protein [Staphylococcus phage vB_SauM-V1SA22]